MRPGFQGPSVSGLISSRWFCLFVDFVCLSILFVVQVCLFVLGFFFLFFLVFDSD
jgi:hypothetical protein